MVLTAISIHDRRILTLPPAPQPPGGVARPAAGASADAVLQYLRRSLSPARPEAARPSALRALEAVPSSV